jgi:gamma-glutamyltranspeptidase/glutathione hydrolase
MSKGLGGDCFALVFDGSTAIGLDGGSPAPRSAHGSLAHREPSSVLVPGVVGTWSTLLERFGRLELDQLLGPAIDAAKNGIATRYTALLHGQPASQLPLSGDNPQY